MTLQASSSIDSSLTKPSTKSNIAILRIGQLSSCTTTGVWNSSEGWPLMLSSVKLVKCLPELDGTQERLTWLPVDIAAKATIDVLDSMISNTPEPARTQNDKGFTNTPKDITGLQVLHVLNPAPRNSPTTRSWSDLLTILHATTGPTSQTTGPTSPNPTPLEIVPTHTWLMPDYKKPPHRTPTTRVSGCLGSGRGFTRRRMMTTRRERRRGRVRLMNSKTMAKLNSRCP